MVLTKVISRRKVRAFWRKVRVQGDCDFSLAELWHFPLTGFIYRARRKIYFLPE